MDAPAVGSRLLVAALHRSSQAARARARAGERALELGPRAPPIGDRVWATEAATLFVDRGRRSLLEGTGLGVTFSGGGDRPTAPRGLGVLKG